MEKGEGGGVMNYEEAITCIKANICYKQEMCSDDICKSTEKRPCAIVAEAIEIVRRGGANES